MDVRKLEETARELVAPGKGILAADESFGTIGKRFEAVGIESSEDSRRAYREMLFTTEGIGEFLSGVILFDETIRQKTSDGTPMPEVLENAGVIPGIKVDKSTVTCPSREGEKFTQGLDGLGDRLAEYRELGARFTKWRAVITIGDGIPTESCIEANAEALALYAAFAQEHDLVPIVEPEVLIDGDHSIEQCYDATEWMLHRDLRRDPRARRRALGDAPEAEHGHLGQGRARTGQRRRGSSSDGRVPAQDRAGGRAWHSLPLRRPDRPAGDGPPQRHELHCTRACPGSSPSPTRGRCRDSRWRSGAETQKGRGGPEGLPPQGEDEQRRTRRRLLGGDGRTSSVKAGQHAQASPSLVSTAAPPPFSISAGVGLRATFGSTSL